MADQSYEDWLEEIHAGFETPTGVVAEMVAEATGSGIASKLRLILGEVNEVYAVTTSSGEELIVRISRRMDQSWFIKERRAMEMARAARVPVPETLLVSDGLEDGRMLSFSIQRKVPGRPFDHLVEELVEGDRIRLFEDAGEMLARLHSIETERYGYLESEGSPAFHETERSFMLDLPDPERLRADGFRMGISWEDLEAAAAVIAGHTEVYDRGSPCLVHGDFGPKHIMVEGGRITGLIDFENAGSADPTCDFAWFDFWHGPSRQPAILNGYRRLRDPGPDFELRVRLNRLRFDLWGTSFVRREQDIARLRDNLAFDLAFFAGDH